MRTPLLAACLLLAACGQAPAPTAEPAASAVAPADPGHHELQGAIDAVDHRDKAAHANDAVEAADKQREKDLEDSGG